MKPHLSASPSLVSISDDDTDDNDNMINYTIGRSAGQQATTQQTREPRRMPNGVRLGLGFGVGIENGSRDDTDMRAAELAPFPCTAPLLRETAKISKSMAAVTVNRDADSHDGL
jgi:hypothetical protein